MFCRQTQLSVAFSGSSQIQIYNNFANLETLLVKIQFSILCLFRVFFGYC